MKTKSFLIFALLCTLVQGAWATDYSVGTDSELRAAIANDGANISVMTDIYLGNSTLSIAEGTTVTINLNGHTLDRGLPWRGEGGGQVITVREGATLNLTGGTLKGGWGGNAGGLANEGGTVNLTDVVITGCKGDDRGGGISNLSGGTLNMTGGAITNNICYDHGDPAGGGGLFNAEEATATLTGVIITSNEDMVCGGGGICNYGTILLDGCTITGNKARTVGGGIWSSNEKHLLRIQGANIITDNFASGVPSNLFLEERRWITITGSITGSRIGIMLDVAPNTFTDGFATYHKGEDPNTFFMYDKPWIDSLAIIQPEPYVLQVGEVIMLRKNLYKKIPFIEHSWDSENNKVVSNIKTLTEEIEMDDTPTSETQYKKLKSNESYVKLGTEDSELHEYYVVEGDELNFYALDVVGPNVHIILRDSAWLHLEKDIGVEKGNTVYFHAQSTASYIGKLTAGGGIGGEIKEGGANIEIHGGNFDLQGTENCAAIGGQYETNGDITIFDGRIKAIGGDCGAGIGSGLGCSNYGNIFIYGGKIDATGSAGIGGGQLCQNGNLIIWDGAITARGKNEAAGIGCNQFAGDYGAGTITINGGYIRAYGDSYAAGIGGGDDIRGGTLNVNGGRVEAYGGTDAAGIGGGEGGNGGIVNINGGYVYAEGNDNGAGIGGGESANGADVTINGGTVVVQAGGDQHAIGAGNGTGSNNNLTFADDLGVFITEYLYRSVKENRVSDCRNNRYVRVKKCAHGGATASIVDGEKHNITSCDYCLVTDEEAHTFGDYSQCAICGLISLADNADNTDVIEHWNGETKSVTLTGRKLYKDNSWNTLTLPFDVTIAGSTLNGAVAKELLKSSNFDGEGLLTLNFSDNLTTIAAGVPYIVKWTSGSNIVSPVFEDVTIDNELHDVISDDGKVEFIGIFSPVILPGGDKENLYLGANNKLYTPSDDRTMNSFRSYFHVDFGTSQIKRYILNFDKDEVITGIVEVEDDQWSMFNVQWSMFNGQSGWFDLSGRRLSGRPAQKGMYIKDGKLVIK